MVLNRMQDSNGTRKRLLSGLIPTITDASWIAQHGYVDISIVFVTQLSVNMEPYGQTRFRVINWNCLGTGWLCRLDGWGETLVLFLIFPFPCFYRPPDMCMFFVWMWCFFMKPNLHVKFIVVNWWIIVPPHVIAVDGTASSIEHVASTLSVRRQYD